MPDFISTIINGIKAWVGAELTKLWQMVTSTRNIAEKAQATANEANANKVNPVFRGSFSQNRLSGSDVGSYSHAEGLDTTASGNSSHAEGRKTIANGHYSHAEGCCTTTDAYYSHAEGYYTTASKSACHAEGEHTIAKGFYSHTEGYMTIASGDSSHVQGKYNIEDNSAKYAHIVGNGTSNTARSNAHTLDWNGVAWFQGRPQFGGTAQDDGSQTVMANGDTEIILSSSTSGSTKKFKITVDNSGNLTATEVTE